MKINGTDIHEWAIEQVATYLDMAAVEVRYRIEENPEAVMQTAVYFAELYWLEKQKANL